MIHTYELNKRTKGNYDPNCRFKQFHLQISNNIFILSNPLLEI